MVLEANPRSSVKGRAFDGRFYYNIVSTKLDFTFKRGLTDVRTNSCGKGNQGLREF